MATNEDKRKIVYDNLVKTGYEDSYEEFDKFMDDPQKRKIVYDRLKNDTGYSDSFEEFDAFMQRPGATPQTDTPDKSSVEAAQSGWQPSWQDKARMQNIQSQADDFSHSVGNSLERMDNIRKGMTQEGRDETRAGEMQARMAGTYVKPLGLTPNAHETSDEIETEEGSQSTRSRQGAKAVGVKLVEKRDENGNLEGYERKTEWELPDGSRTTNFGEADIAEYSGREERNREEAVKNLRLKVEERLTDAESRLKSLMDQRQEEQEKEKPWYANIGAPAVAGTIQPKDASRMSTTGKSVLDSKIEEATAEVAQLRQSIDEFDKRAKAADSNWYQKIGQGLVNGLIDPNTWTFGVYNASLNNTGKIEEAKELEAMAPDAGGFYEGGKFAGEMLFAPEAYAGHLVGRGVKNALVRGIAGKAGKKMSKEMAERYVANSLGKRLGLHAAEQSGNFAIFEGLGDARQQLIDGGWTDDEGNFHNGFSVAHVLGKMGKGVGTGALIGLFGSTVSHLGDKATKAIENTAGKVATRGIQQGMGLVGEGTIFAAPELVEFYTMDADKFDNLYAEKFGYAGLEDQKERDKARQEARESLVWDNWGASVGNIAGMKMAGKLTHPFASVNHAKDIIRQLKGDDGRNGLSFSERVAMMADRSPFDFTFTKDELSELKEGGYEDIAKLLTKEQVTGDNYNWNASGTRVGGIDGYDELGRLLENPNISEATRAKAYNIVTGRMLPMSPVKGYDVKEDNNGGFIVNSLGDEGQIVTSERAKTKEGADKLVSKIERQSELNRIDEAEKIAESISDENLFRTAAREVMPGAQNTLVETLYSLGKSGKVSDPAIHELTKKIDSYIEENQGKRLDTPRDIRNLIKAETGVDLDKALKKEASSRNEREKEAVERYQEELNLIGERQEELRKSEKSLIENSAEIDRFIETLPEQVRNAVKAAQEEERMMAESEYYSAQMEAAYEEGKDAVKGAESEISVKETGESQDTSTPMAIDEYVLSVIAEEAQRAREEIDKAFGSDSEEILSMLEENPMSVLVSQEYDGEQKEVALAYVNAMARLEGADRGIAETTEAKKEAVKKAIEDQTNKETGMIQPAVMNGEKPVFIVNGEVVMFPDGKGVDSDKSSESIIIFDPEEGKMRFANPRQVLRLEKASRAEDALEQAYAELDAEATMQSEKLKTETGKGVAENGKNVPENADSGTSSVQNVPENGLNDTQNVPNPTEYVSLGDKVEQPETAMSKIPVDEETGKPRWHEVEADIAFDALVEKSKGNEERATGFAKMQLEGAKKAVKEAEKIKITDTDDFDEYDRQAEAKQKAIEEAKAIQQHWQRVVAIPGERRAQAEAEERAIKEAEEAERKSLKKIDQRLAEAYDEVKDVPEALERLKQHDPETLDEAAAIVLSSNKLLWGDKDNRKGVSSETGFGEGERRKMFGMFASREKGGKSIQKLAEDEMKQICDSYGIPYDNQEARNALIEVIQTSSTPSDIRKYIERRRAEQALEMKDAILRREEEAEEEWYQMNYGMSKADHDTYEEMKHSDLSDLHENFNEEEYYGRIADELADIEEMKEKGLEEMDKNFNPEEYYGNIADELANQERIENERRDSEAGGFPVRSIQEDGRERTVEDDVRGGEILPGEETDITRGLAENENRPEIFSRDGQKGLDTDADLSGGTRGTVGDQIRQAEAEVNTQPTDKQKEAGNYKKGHVKIGKFDVTIENPKGSIRSGKDANGKEWQTEMKHTYGYIRGTKGVDGDHIDVYASSDIDGWKGDKVFVVDQYNPDGSFDEHKVMLGFNNKEEAYNAYLSNYEKDWEKGRRIDITEVSTPEFEKWIDSSKRKTKPFAEYKFVKKITEEVDQKRTNINDEGLLIDKEGQPMVLYHGTPNNVRRLSDLEQGHFREGEETGARFNGEGISFSPDRIVAEEYSNNGKTEGKIFSAEVVLKKPYYTVGVANFTPEEAKEFTDGLKARGYDGIINYSSEAMREIGAEPAEVILFDIKSAKEVGSSFKDTDVMKEDIFQQAERIAQEIQEKKKAVQAKKAQENKIEDFGEKISGARKDALKDLAKNVENVTIQSLIEQPLGKAFKKPDIKKLYESGAVSEQDALLAEAVMQGLVLANKKPALTKRISSRKDIEKWAEETYRGIHLLGEILSGDPTRRERALLEHKENLQKQAERVNEHIKKLREWNPDKEFKDVERMPDPLEVTRIVLEGIGYRPGDKVELPLTHVVFDGRHYKVDNAGKQSVWFKRYHNNLDDAIETMILAAKLKRGDTDVELPQDLYGLKGIGQRHYEPTGKYSVQYWGKGKFNIKEKIFDNETEAKDFAEKNNGHIIPQQKATNIFDRYAVTVTNPLTGERHELKEFNDRMDALGWIDENREEANTAALGAINKEMGVKGNERSHFYVASNYVGGEKRFVYSVMEEDKNNPWPFIKDFSTRKEAEQWLKENKDRLEKERKERKEAERKIVYFSTEGRDRKGPDYREGKDSTPEMYDENFGFRGVQFGNWANQADRREAMDQAFDSFKDLARLTGLPERTMSLDGELGLAFGARGSGSALAHYEPSEVVINLTKTRGAGSLAHEWWHALDNLLSRRAGVPMGFLTHKNGIDNANSEVAEAFNTLMNAVKGSAYGRRSEAKGAYWGQETEMTARLFAEWISEKLHENGEDNGFLARGVDASAMKMYQQMNYNAYRNNEIRKAELSGKEPEIMSREEFYNSPESLRGFPYPTADEVRAFSPYMERVFDALREREQSTGSMANEPRKSYGRRMARESGKSLFDWADENEVTSNIPDRGELNREMERAGEEANRAIDEYSENFSKYLRRSEEIETELAKEGLEETERIALEQESKVIEEVILEEKERLTYSLREFYAKNNTPEDAEMLSREMASRVQAEVSVRLNGKRLLDDLLASAKEITSSGEPVSRMKESEGDVKTAGGTISYMAKGHLPDAEKGEFSYVERQFLRSGAFSFTGRDKIRDRGDVAYIFKELENYSIENVFAVMQREDGSYKIVHIGMGTPTSSPADLGAIRGAYDAFGADKIWLVHNHPSGVLNASAADRDLMQKIEKAFEDLNVETEGIIMDTRSGRYVSFRGEGMSARFEREKEMEDKPVEVYSFDRMDRSKEPEEKEKLNQPNLVVNYISKLREGKEPRVSYLLLNNQLEVMGNFHTDYKEMGDPALAQEMASVGIKYGAKAIIPYGNVDLTGVRALNEGVKNYSMGDLRIVDALHIDSEGRHKTAYEAGLMEPEGNYGKDADISEAERAMKIRDLKPIEVKPNNLSKEELKNVYDNLEPVEKDGNNIEFYRSAFKKVYKEGGLSAQAIPALREVLENSILAYSEPDTLGGKIRKDGTEHKEHKNILSFDNYVGKMKLEGKEYFVRFTVQNEKDRSGTHSFFVSNVELYEKPTESQTIPITSRGTTGFDGIPDTKLAKFFERAKSTEENKNEVRDAGATYSRVDLKEAIRGIQEDLKIANKENLEEKKAAMRKIGGNLSKLRQAMARQKEYDQDTAKQITDLAQSLMDAGLMDMLSKTEFKRILSAVKNAVGKESTAEQVTKVVDILIDNQLRAGEKAYTDAIKLKTKTDARGVEKGGNLDAEAKDFLATLRQARALPAESYDAEGGVSKGCIAYRMLEAQDKMGSDDAVIADRAANEYRALQVAYDYSKNIGESKAEERDLRKEIKDAEEEYEGKIRPFKQERDSRLAELKEQKESGTISEDIYKEAVSGVRKRYKEQVERLKPEREALKQFVEATENAIRDNKIERAEAYEKLTGELGDMRSESAQRVKEWREAEKKRIQEIHHNANSDMEGRISNEHGRKATRIDRVVNSSGFQFFMKPLATFDQMLRMFGDKNARGEGYLWNRYMRGWLGSQEKEFKGYQNALKELDDKVSNIFKDFNGVKGVKINKWGDLFTLDRKLPKAWVKFWDGGEMRDHELTQGNLLYIYMADKMADGQMKLRRMGITEEDIANIEAKLLPEFKQLADWMQDEYLPKKREEYNATHQRMFGTGMAAIEYYFPLKILSNARVENVDLSQDANRDIALPATATGSIIKRTRNSLALDLTGANAFSVMLDHLQEMEHWNAFSEFNRDLNTLLSYSGFRNKVMNMKSVYGSGKKLWTKFRNSASLAAGAYRPPVAEADKDAVNFAKGVTAAKVSFRVFTALKQFLSFPAYFPEANLMYIAKNIANPVGAWKWSMDNLPMFEKRWKSRMAGDPRLLKTDMDWKQWRNKYVQMASRIGMSPNAFVDALTVSMGAYSIYETKLAKYRRMGYDEAKAIEKAKQEATILYNQTQQSSESAFLSTMQVDRSWLSVLFTVFRNSSMSYARQEYDALRNLAKKARGGKDGFKQSVEFMAKQYLREMWPEKEDRWSAEERVKARDLAKKEFRQSMIRDMARVATFGFIMQMAWNMGAYLPYMLLGKDEEEKEKMWDDAFTHAMWGSVEGLTAGDAVSNGINYLRGLESFDWNNLKGLIKAMNKEMPMTSDFQRLSYSDDFVTAMNDVVNLVVQSGFGFNPQSITDAVAAIWDACNGDMETGREVALLMARIANCPPNQLDKIYFDELDAIGTEAAQMAPKEIAERYAEYKIIQGAPFTFWMRGDEKEQEIKDKKEKKVFGIAKEKLGGKIATEETKSLLAEYDEVNKAQRELSELRNLRDKEGLRDKMDEMKERYGDKWRFKHRLIGRYKSDMAKLSKLMLATTDIEDMQRIVDQMLEKRQEILEKTAKL